MANNRLMSADLGKGWVKVKSSTEERIYRSVISAESESIFFDSPFDANGQFLIETDGKKYAVGDTVFTKGLVPIHIEDRSRINTGFYRILFASALAAVIRQTSEVEAVVSLPPAAYWDKEQQKERLAGSYEVRVPTGHGTPKTLTYTVPYNNIRVIPEGMGALCEIALDETGRMTDKGDELFKRTVGVVDIGTGTVDLLKFERLVLSRDGTNSRNTGVAKTVLQRIKQHASKNGIDLADHKLDSVLRERFYIDGSVKGQRRQIDDEIEGWIAEQASAVDAFIRSEWNGGNGVEYIIVTGGGANLVYPYLRDTFGDDRTFVSEGNPQFSNCEGGYRYGLLKQLQSLKA
jgi:hypothetical protein